MAEQHLTTSVYSTHSLNSEWDVSDEAGTPAGLSRRSVMGMLSAIATVPAVGTPSRALALVTTSRGAWDNALAEYRRADAAFDAAIARFEAAEEAADDACPRVDRYFDEYKLGMGMRRERVVDALEWHNRLSTKQLDVQAIAEEFVAYQEKNAAVRERFKVAELDQAVDELRPAWREAREALMEIPAPDNEALLVKMEIATMTIGEDDLERTLSDARRLLAVN